MNADAQAMRDSEDFDIYLESILNGERPRGSSWVFFRQLRSEERARLAVRDLEVRKLLQEILNETWILTRYDIDRLLSKVGKVKSLMGEPHAN